MQFGYQGYIVYLKIYYLKYNTILKILLLKYNTMLKNTIKRLNELTSYLENYLGRYVSHKQSGFYFGLVLF